MTVVADLTRSEDLLSLKPGANTRPHDLQDHEVLCLRSSQSVGHDVNLGQIGINEASQSGRT